MKFKEIFDRAVLTEEYVRKGLKIFYEIDLDLIKAKAELKVQNPQQSEQNLQQATQQPQQNPQQPQEQQPQQEPVAQPPEQSQQNDDEIDINSFNASVVTEDEVAENTEEKIVRKFEGIANLSNSEKDNIQSFEDVVDTLSKFKKNGTEVLDEFSTEIINLCMQQNFQEIKNKLDKKSKIFVEIYYGYKKDDSVGLRFSKRPNSELLTSTMMIDNEIVSSKFNMEKLNQQVAEYRNYDANK